MSAAGLSPHSLHGSRTDPEAMLQRVFEATPKDAVRAALIGRGILKSRTPQMHVAEGRRLGMPYVYELIDFDQLGLEAAALCPLVRAAATQGVSGLNVTHPFKQQVLGCLDGLSPNAAAIGAVNTVVLRSGSATGHNTDCWGFAESFRRDMAGAALGNILLLGAGGAGMAVGRALLDLGAGRIGIFDLRAERAEALAAGLQKQFGVGRATVVEDVPAASRQADGLVNTTPVGMASYPGVPVPVEVLRPDVWVADVIYFPAETELLRSARAAGCRTVSGRGMAIFQAVRAFELITGLRPDPDAMARHFAETDEPRRAPPD